MLPPCRMWSVPIKKKPSTKTPEGNCWSRRQNALMPPAASLLLLLLLLLLVAPQQADGHAAMVQPRPRNAVEGSIYPWNGSVPDFEPVSGSNEGMSTWCPIASGIGHGVADSSLSGINGQSCFWFSNGYACNGDNTEPFYCGLPGHG